MCNDSIKYTSIPAASQRASFQFCGDVTPHWQRRPPQLAFTYNSFNKRNRYETHTKLAVYNSVLLRPIRVTIFAVKTIYYPTVAQIHNS